MSEREMRGEILALVREYCAKYHAPKADFAPGTGVLADGGALYGCI